MKKTKSIIKYFKNKILNFLKIKVKNYEYDYINVGVGTYGHQHIKIHSWTSDQRLTIGKYCSIADNVHIFLGGDHNTRSVSTFPFGRDEDLMGQREGHPKSKGDVKIGNDVWIASNVSIMSGVTIGDGAVVAAFSHVVRDVKPYELVGGNPAAHIRFRVPEEDIIELLKLSWWDLPKEIIHKHRDLLVSDYNKEILKKINELKKHN